MKGDDDRGVAAVAVEEDHVVDAVVVTIIVRSSLRDACPEIAGNATTTKNSRKAACKRRSWWWTWRR